MDSPYQEWLKFRLCLDHFIFSSRSSTSPHCFSNSSLLWRNLQRYSKSIIKVHITLGFWGGPVSWTLMVFNGEPSLQRPHFPSVLWFLSFGILIYRLKLLEIGSDTYKRKHFPRIFSLFYDWVQVSNF